MIGIIHLGITFLLSFAFKSYKSPINKQKTALSIIIAARNEEENLKRLIPALLEQEFPSFEVIIALDRCSDNSKNYLQKLGDQKIKSIDIHEVDPNWNPKKYALNHAITSATGDWLVFTDADCIPNSKNWLQSVNDHISTNLDIIIGVSPYRANGSLLTYFIQFEAFMTAFTYISRSLLGKPYMAVGRNMVIRRSFFKKVGGYEEIKSITGGDDDLFIQQHATKANTRVMLGNESMVYTFAENTWKDYWHQKIRHLSVGGRYKSSDQLFLGVNHFCQFAFYILLFFVTTHSFFFPMLLFYLFIKLGSYRFATSKIGININYILLPLVDIIYAVLIPVVALRSKLEKDIKWKN